MFKRTTEKQLDIFKSPNSLLSKKAELIYEDEKGWHNQFRLQVTMRIDEALFEPLFTKGTGSPNASVRTMVAMMILKEANGWSDSQLFEHCRFNILIKRALGLYNMDDSIPAESTYYSFRKRIVDHEKQGKENLLESTFTAVTKGQAKEFQVSGRSIRMDSKLLGSNIAWLSRYELVHETLRLFCSKTGIEELSGSLTPSEMELVKSLASETGEKVVYRCSGEEVNSKLVELGLLAYRLLAVFEGSSQEHYATLSRLFKEQFEVSEGKTVLPKPKESIQADSIQSPHDTDCTYRNKDGNKVKGYSVNLTESCDKEGVNLISGVDVKKADAADNTFLESGTKRAEEVFGNPVENIHTDGAYHSPSNQEFVKEKNAKLFLNAIQGFKGRYDLEIDENGILKVTDLKDNTTVEAVKMEKSGKWRIKLEKNYRYFTDKELTACQLRKKIEAIPQHILNIRNNVEATIFQLGYHYSNDKTRYRGLSRTKMWANVRCLWVNFVRILKHVKQTGQNAPSSLQMNRLVGSFVAFIDQFEPLFKKITPIFKLKSILYPQTPFIALS
jgi:hypothetical protein